MFKPETIKKYIALAMACIVKLQLIADTLSVTLSRGNRKIGRFANVSLAPIVSCGNCCGCKSFCYDLKACLAYPSVLFARCKNFLLARDYRDKYFADIIRGIKNRDRRGKSLKGFRWHVGGDILDYDYFCRMVDIARMYPGWDFWTYTKMYHLVNRYVREHGGTKAAAIPSNLHIMFSVWYGMPIDNRYGFATFRCILKDGSCSGRQQNEFMCPGNCELCFKSRAGCIGEHDSCVNEH